MQINCKNNHIINLHQLNSENGFWCSDDDSQVSTTIAGISSYRGNFVIYYKENNIIFKGYGNPLYIVSADEYRDCHSIGILDDNDDFIYCVFKDNAFHFGLFNNQKYIEYLVVGEDSIKAELREIRAGE